MSLHPHSHPCCLVQVSRILCQYNSTGDVVASKKAGEKAVTKAAPKAAPKAQDEKAEILAQVFEGMTNGRTVADTCRELKVRPGTVRQWIARDPAWTAEYQRCRPLLGAALAEEAIRVARESTTQTTAMDRVLIETLKWAAAKSAPAEYGEKQLVQHEGQQTLQVKVIEDDVPVRNVKALTAASREAAVTAVLKAAAESPVRALPAPDPDEMS